MGSCLMLCLQVWPPKASACCVLPSPRRCSAIPSPSWWTWILCPNQSFLLLVLPIQDSLFIPTSRQLTSSSRILLFLLIRGETQTLDRQAARWWRGQLGQVEWKVTVKSLQCIFCNGAGRGQKKKIPVPQGSVSRMAESNGSQMGELVLLPRGPK